MINSSADWRPPGAPGGLFFPQIALYPGLGGVLRRQGRMFKFCHKPGRFKDVSLLQNGEKRVWAHYPIAEWGGR